jgi:glycosyltransferase involved in cell wall biosynthesis
VPARAEQVFRERLEHMRGELERAQMVICPSVALKREMTAVWPELEARLSVIPHGIETAWGAMVKWQGSERVRFAYLGALTPHKGIEVLLEAFSRVDRRRAELTLWGAWASQDPEFRRRVEAVAAASGARLRGRYERAHLPAILGETDVVVLASTCKETASLVVREAFVGGAPVIASDLGALPEAVEDGANGLLVRPGDPDDLAQKMNEIANDPGLLAHLRANVRPPKSIAVYAAEISEIYERLGRRASA